MSESLWSRERWPYDSFILLTDVKLSGNDFVGVKELSDSGKLELFSGTEVCSDETREF